jgi:transposase
MTPIQRYELIRPILSGEKTVGQVHNETDVPKRTLHRYVKRFREGGGQLDSLVDQSPGPRTHPNWLTDAQKQLVIDYKQAHPDKSARQIAQELTEAKIIKISDHSVADLLKRHSGGDPPFYLNGRSSPT